MAQDGGGRDDMGYEAMVQEAMRGVVKTALERAASPRGLPGAHHFYVTFRTGAPGVSAPPDLLEKYPDEMTIVLQHQYWNMTAGETSFAVTLKFGGEPQELSVPYRAISRFYDPSVQFLLQFTPGEGEVERTPAALPSAVEPEATASDEPKVISLDQFRKK